MQEAAIPLSLKGRFSIPALTDSPATRFSFEAGLLYQSFQGQVPVVRIVLDEALILEITQISETQIDFLLPQRYLSELNLVGQHSLRLHAGADSKTASIQVGSPLATQALFASLDSVQYLVSDGNPSIRLTGKAFLLNPTWQAVSIDGNRIPIASVEILSDGKSVLLAALNQALNVGPHVVRYESPMGVAASPLEVN